MNDQENIYQGGETREEPPRMPPPQERTDYTREPGPGWRSNVYGPRKSPFLASLLSMMPGLGQIYVGYYTRGFIHLAIVATLITALASGDIRGLEPFFGLSLAFFWLYNIIDAGRRATRYNQIAEGGSSEELPEFRDDLGGRAAGIILVVLGGILLLHTRVGFDFYWLEEWWPVGLVVFGVYLIRKNQTSKS